MWFAAGKEFWTRVCLKRLLLPLTCKYTWSCFLLSAIWLWGLVRLWKPDRISLEMGHPIKSFTFSNFSSAGVCYIRLTLACSPLCSCTTQPHLVSSFLSQSALSAPLLIWCFWWMAHGVLEEKTSSTSAASCQQWPVPLTLGRIRPEWVWSSTAPTPAQSSTWTNTSHEENSSEPSKLCLTREATPWQVLAPRMFRNTSVFSVIILSLVISD